MRHPGDVGVSRAGRRSGSGEDEAMSQEERPLDYRPTPLDTSRVTLTPEWLARIEVLARHVHDVWARKRLSDGWRYGPNRSDGCKEHPDLVPYELLPPTEQEYNRTSALETIKGLLALGYQIELPQTTASPAISRSPEATETILELLKSPAPLDLTFLLGLWRGHDPEQWSSSPELYRALGKRIIKLGEPLLAYDVVCEGLERWPTDARLRQLQGLASLRSGALERGEKVLDELQREGHVDEETLGVLAGTKKALALQSREQAERAAHLSRAAEAYLDAYRQTKGYWTGINAATMHLLIGDKGRAVSLAREVYDQCLTELDMITRTGDDPYWVLASLGEAALLLGRGDEAVEWYTRTARVGQGRWGDLSSTRRQARLLLEHLGIDRDRIEGCFQVPRVVVFTGHQLDQPDRPRPRFPSRMAPAVQEAIRERLKALNARFGYASAASGSDLLFQEAILELGGEAHVVLPYNRDQFRAGGIEVAAGPDWVSRFESVLQRATTVLTASEQPLHRGGDTYEYANLLLEGLATIRAGQLETELVRMAVWDGEPGGGPGGTAGTVGRWRAAGHDVELIDLARLMQSECSQPAFSSTATVPSREDHTISSLEGPQPAIMAMLFADVVGSSRLREDDIPLFVEHYLGMVGELASASPHAPVVRDTWGDGLYLVFSSVGDAGSFALQLRDLVSRTDWTEKGLSCGLELRIAVHAGPVYRCVDPVTGELTFTGTHVRRAARMEPITPPNQVYASEPFAALASAMQVRDFVCEYVGQTPLPKGYGTLRTYHLRWSH
jgi:class 3 adenylate cyclase